MQKGMSLRKKVLIACISMVFFPIFLMLLTTWGIRCYLSSTVARELTFALTDQKMAKDFMFDMLIAIALILILTAFLMCRFILRGLIAPISDLSLGMTKIKQGDFDFQLTSNQLDGEMGMLYDNYEQMRLRLKETTQLELESEQKNRELISNISHDLKTPITAIKGYVEGIMDGIADTDEKMDRYIKTIYNKANDMDRLINELTLYSGIDSNQIPYHFHRLNVKDYFTDCVEEVGLDLAAKNIEFNFYNLLAEDTKIIADPEQIRRVINNIVGNSVKYLKKSEDTDDAEDLSGGIIEIRLLDQIDSIHIEIEDNGTGISQKDLSRIFERFYRTDSSRNSKQGGSGIGLSIVKKIIEDHGGYIWATSKEGEGTCMHIVFRKYEESDENE